MTFYPSIRATFLCTGHPGIRGKDSAFKIPREGGGHRFV